MDLSNETGIKTLRTFDHLRFVRQAEWPYPYMPNCRALNHAEVLAYSYDKTGKPLRVFYVLATETDGIEEAPDENDQHDGVPVVPKTVACCTTPMAYRYCPDDVAALERKRRASHVGFWNLQKKLEKSKHAKQTTPAKRRRWWLLWLF